MTRFLRVTLTLFLLFISACNKQSTEHRVGHTLRVPITAIPDVKLERGNNINGNKVIDNVFEHLVGLDESLSPVPELARSWSINRGQNEVEFELETSKHFHDGSPVTSKDVLEVIREAYRNENEVLSQFLSLKGCLQKTVCEGFEVLSDSRFKIRIRNSNFSLLMKKLAGAKGVILKKSGGSLYGTGPYKIKSGDTKQMDLERSAERAHFQAIVLSVLDSQLGLEKFIAGEIDILSDVESAVDKSRIPETAAFTKKIAGTYSLVFDQKRSIFRDRDIRKAVALVIDPDAFHRTEVSNNIPAGGLIPKGYLGFTQKRHEHDLTKARQIIFNATTPSQRIVTIGIRDKFKGNKAVEEYLPSAFREIGLTLRVTFLPFDDILEKFRQGRLDMMLKGDAPINFDPSTAFDGYVGKQMKEFTGYSNPQLNGLVSRYEDALEENVKLQILAEMESVFKRDIPAVPLFYAVATTWYQPGLSVRNSGNISVRFWNFSYQDVYKTDLARN